MSVWTDVYNDYSGGGYAGLSPQAALQKWFATQQQIKAAGLQPGQPGPNGEVLGSMETLAKENPEAFRIVAQGQNQQGGTRQVFNPQTGQFDTQKTHGWLSHPESWIQLGLGGAMGAAAPAAIASGAGGAAAPVAGEVGTGTLVGGTGSTLGTLGPAGWSGAAGAGGAVAGPTVAGGSTLGRLAPYLIGAGTDILGGYMGSKASKTAAEQQIASGDRALAALQGAYAQQQAAYNPYAQIGVGALGNLGALTGIQRPTATSVASAPTSPMVSLRAPDGSVQQVPADHVDHYVSLGAQRV